jgi:nitrogen regulatory protein P-II 1
MPPAPDQDLIVTIIKKGYAERIIEASREAGAEGATIMFGRGTGVHEQKKLLGIPIEPEKEIIFTVVPAEISGRVLEAIIKAGKLERPATGIAFVLELKKVAGVVHLLRDQA